MLNGSHTFTYKIHQWSIIERRCDRSCKSFALVYVSQKTYLTHKKSLQKMIKYGFHLIRNLIVKNASLMRHCLYCMPICSIFGVVRVIYRLTQTRKESNLLKVHIIISSYFNYSRH